MKTKRLIPQLTELVLGLSVSVCPLVGDSIYAQGATPENPLRPVKATAGTTPRSGGTAPQPGSSSARSTSPPADASGTNATSTSFQAAREMVNESHRGVATPVPGQFSPGAATPIESAPVSSTPSSSQAVNGGAAGRAQNPVELPGKVIPASGTVAVPSSAAARSVNGNVPGQVTSRTMNPARPVASATPYHSGHPSYSNYSRFAARNSVLTQGDVPQARLAVPQPEPDFGMPPTASDAIQGEMLLQGDAWSYGGGCGGEMGCGGGCGGTCGMGWDGCGGACGDSCGSCCLYPCPLFSLDTLQLFAGVHGFTGPANRGGTGSFGFHEGANWGGPMPCFPELLSVQFGVRATQSNFEGSNATSESRNQIFLTGGIFRRVDWGVQGGVVVDYLSDQWYYNTDLAQLRGEVSWVFPCQHELGFWFSAGLSSSQSLSVFDRPAQAQATERWEPTDLYAFFYRHRFDECVLTEGRFYAGFTGESDGFLGADLNMPLNDSLAVSSGFAYLVPHESTGAGPNAAHVQESWNLGITLTWYPGCSGSRGRNYCRPLFGVADNGSFMVDRTAN